MKEEQETKNKILQYYRWDLIRYARSEALGKKFDELEVMRFLRAWCIKIATYQVFATLLERVKGMIESKRIEMAEIVIAKRMLKFAEKKLT